MVGHGQGRLSSGKGESRLRLMLREMYGDWELFCHEVSRAFGSGLFEGIVGSCVMITRAAYERIGLLDERIQAADWDLYYTLRKREAEVGDLRRCMVVGGVFVHHFIRATVKSKPEPFGCTHPNLSIDQKWDRTEQARLWCKPEDFSAEPSFLSRLVKKPVVRPLQKLGREFDRTLAWRWLWVSPERIVNLYRRQFELLGPGTEGDRVAIS